MADNLLERLSPLGKRTAFIAQYDPALLCAVPRSLAREKLGIKNALPFAGFDFWTCYELCWLSEDALPQVAVCKLKIPSSAPNLIESKSLKLYLNSLSGSQFKNAQAVRQVICSDLQKLLKCAIEIELILPEDWSSLQTSPCPGICLDKLMPSKHAQDRDIQLLKTSDAQVHETFYSNLFRSLCPVTGQPDWATVSISYLGNKIEPSSLLGYLLSLREHQGFHEECAELIFVDLMHACSPKQLQVQLNFTRRGGIEINPLRCTPDTTLSQIDSARLARQ